MGKSGLTELKARDASCPKGKKMEHKMNLTNRKLRVSTSGTQTGRNQSWELAHKRLNVGLDA